MNKKKIIALALSGVLAIGGMTLVGCGKGKEKDKGYAYTELSTIISDIKGNNALFENRQIGSLKTDFCFSSLSGNNNYYNQLFVIPMTYIDKNYSKLEESSQVTSGVSKKIINELNNSVDALKNSYEKIEAQYLNLSTFPQEGTIYEGALQQFKYKCTDFIYSTYQVAIALSEYDKSTGTFESMKTRQLSITDTSIMRDYVSLRIGKDYFDLLLDSSNSKLFSAESGNSNIENFRTFIESAKTDLSNYVSGVLTTNSLKSLQGEKLESEYNNILITEILETENNMNKERDILAKSFNKVSMFKFYEFYNCNMKDYVYDVKYADVYYNQIQSYFNNYIKLQTQYFKSTLINA